eukprot:UN19065
MIQLRYKDKGCFGFVNETRRLPIDPGWYFYDCNREKHFVYYISETTLLPPKNGWVKRIARHQAFENVETGRSTTCRQVKVKK